MIRELFLENLSLWTCVWQSTVFAVIGLAGSWFFRRRPARASQALFLAMIAAVVVPAISVLVKYYELGVFIAEPIETQVETREISSATPYGTFSVLTVSETHNETIEAATDIVLIESSSEGASIPWRTIALYGWMIATIILLGRLFVAFINGVHLLRRAQSQVCEHILQAADIAQEKLGVTNSLHVRSSRDIQSPVIWCWRPTPVLLVPGDLDRRVDWVGVICHELAHWRRWDHVSGLIAELIVCLLPWNLLLWFSKKRMIRLSEQACDDWVIAGGRSCEDYAQSLLNFKPQKQAAFVPAIVHSKKGLAGRIRRILKENCGNPRTGFVWILGVSLAAIGLAVGVAFAQTRPAEVEDAPAVTKAEEVIEPDEPMVIVDFKNADMKTVLAKLAEWTGKVIIPTEEASRVRITIIAPEKLPQSKALALIYRTLRMKGFVARHAEDAIYIESSNGLDFSEIPKISLDQSLSKIKDKEQIVQKFFKLKHYNVSQMGQIILPLVSENGYVSADDQSNSLLVIDTVKNLMKIETIISQFDETRAERTVVEIFPVRYKEPSEIIRSLRTLINDQTGADSLTSALTGPDKQRITLIPEPKRNWIIVRATPEDMKQISKWIEKLDSKEPDANVLPESWSLYYDNGLTPGGGKRWPGNMADNLASLETVPRPFNISDESWRNETFEFNIRALDGARIGNVSVRPEPRTGEMSRKIFQPDKYLLSYRREWGKPGNIFRMNCGPFLLDISKPGMYDLQFAPKLGEVEITGSAGGCYAVNFEKIDQGFPIQGYAYNGREKEYTLDGLPPGTYRLSAVAQQQNGNVLVSQAEVTIKSEEKVTVDIAPPAKGDCSLKGTILGRQKTYSISTPVSHQSQGRWFVLIRKPGSGNIVTTFAYEALTMDSLYVVRGDNITQETTDKASYKIEGIVPGEYTVTAIEDPRMSGSVITRQQSKPLILKAGQEAVMDFDLIETK